MLWVSKKLAGNELLQPNWSVAGVYVFCRKYVCRYIHNEGEFKNSMGFSKNAFCNESFEICFMIMSVLKAKKKNPFIKKG